MSIAVLPVAAAMTKDGDKLGRSAASLPHLWSRDNLLAWCVAPPWDANKRGPEQRAQMLRRLGFKHFAYNWRPDAIPSFDAEIAALKKHNIERPCVIT